MLGRLSTILFIVLLCGGAIMVSVLPALADEVYPVHKDFQRFNSGIVIHLIEVNVTDHYMGNIYPSKSPEETKWAHLFYQYENTGNTTETGSIQYELIDTNGNVYKFNPNGLEYSGETVGPHSKSIVRWDEIPIPKDTVLAKLHVYEGTNPDLRLADETYDLPHAVTSTPTTAPGRSSMAGSPTPLSTGCLGALVPLLIVGSVAIVGIYTKGRGIKK